ncbi:MAG: SDR family oxidoreductase [Candidatus Binataceae bacterium]|jgi:NAD(P)-dependent dehydrogenase (short-subunit alcohol dehydrogenase family)
MGKLDGKVAFITGSGSGIGRAGAILFAREGAKVAVAEISREGGEETVALARQAGGAARFIHTDVTDPASVERAIAETVQAFGKITVLYNNAGGSTADDGPVTKVSLDEFWRAIKLDLFGTFVCSKYGIPEIIKAGGGAVINTTSYVALAGIKGRDAYTAAKGGVLALTRSLAANYAKYNVRVNAIAPGAIQTERVKRFLAADPRVSTMSDHHLLGMGVPEDIAHMALFLASDDARIITGAIYPVDSGWSAT